MVNRNVNANFQRKKGSCEREGGRASGPYVTQVDGKGVAVKRANSLAALSRGHKPVELENLFLAAAYRDTTAGRL